MGFSDIPLWMQLAIAMLLSCAVSYLSTPPVKNLAEKLGAIDAPDNERRINDHPVPRMGGLAIFLGFILTVLVFFDMESRIKGLLLGASIIALMGALDDVVDLSASLKLVIQIVAALIAYRSGIVFNVISSLDPNSADTFFSLGSLSMPLTVLWIVGCTNAVNLIDGLDGLAVGVSSISSLTMLVVALFVSEPSVALLLAALTGACLGFIPYNINPAKIFMGDIGSQVLGFLLSTISMIGMLKFHAIITFVVPMLSMAVPLFDTIASFVRRVLHGQSPFKADNGHIHHRLIALGLNQKQAVAFLYCISAILGLAAVLLAGNGAMVKIICLELGFVISLGTWLYIFVFSRKKNKKENRK